MTFFVVILFLTVTYCLGIQFGGSAAPRPPGATPNVDYSSTFSKTLNALALQLTRQKVVLIK